MRGDAGTGRPKLNELDKLIIVVALRTGHSMASIARYFQVTPKTVYNVGKRYGAIA